MKEWIKENDDSNCRDESELGDVPQWGAAWQSSRNMSFPHDCRWHYYASICLASTRPLLRTTYSDVDSFPVHHRIKMNTSREFYTI